MKVWRTGLVLCVFSTIMLGCHSKLATPKIDIPDIPDTPKEFCDIYATSDYCTDISGLKQDDSDLSTKTHGALTIDSESETDLRGDEIFYGTERWSEGWNAIFPHDIANLTHLLIQTELHSLKDPSLTLKYYIVYYNQEGKAIYKWPARGNSNGVLVNGSIYDVEGGVQTIEALRKIFVVAFFSEGNGDISDPAKASHYISLPPIHISRAGAAK